MKSVNVNTDGIEIIEHEKTGIALISVDKQGENSIIVVSGANSEITKEIIDRNIHLIEEADIIVMQLEIPIQTVCYVAKLAKEKGKMVVLDPAPARKDLPEELFSNIDIIKPNETEIEILSDIKIENKEDYIKAAKELLYKGVKTVIITLRKRWFYSSD